MTQFDFQIIVAAIDIVIRFQCIAFVRRQPDSNQNDFALFCGPANREGNHPDDFSKITYKKLLQEVCRFANVLKSLGVRRGDTVSIYMPMVLELPIAMLACARIGAIHSIVVNLRPFPKSQMLLRA